ncbi:hypothetical protein DOY81_008242 [Sarcophaga bullata]|nr:hypothetical protein DOY81_008242 [Sarcophaga bullata]
MEIQLKATQQQPPLPPPLTLPPSLPPTVTVTATATATDIHTAETLAEPNIEIINDCLVRQGSPYPYRDTRLYTSKRTNKTTTRESLNCRRCSDNEEISHLPFSIWALRNTDSSGTYEQ